MPRRIAFVVALGLTAVLGFALLSMGAGGSSSGDGGGATADLSTDQIPSTEVITVPALAGGAAQDLSLPSAAAPDGPTQWSSFAPTDDASSYVSGDDDDYWEHGSASDDDRREDSHEHEGQEVYDD